MKFRNRHDAGRLLAQDLAGLAHDDPVIVALPRGGVPVGFEVARALGAPLEVLAVRKLGAPRNPEFAVGAVVEDGTLVLDEHVAASVDMSRAALGDTIRREMAELSRRVERYRAGRPMAPVEGRTVVVVDDGLATGLTDLAAVRALKSRNPRRIILAVPVGAADSVRRLAAVADEVVCPHVPHNFTAVGLWYEDFAQVSDDEVVDLLARVRVEQQPPDEAQQDVAHHREVAFDIADRRVMASLVLPERGARGLILFAHGSGSSRHSPRNLKVAEELAAAGYASLLMDLLTPDEAADRARVFDTRLLADRLLAVTRWVRGQPGMGRLPFGYFGASTGAAAALRAAARLGPGVAAVVSRGGRPDLAEEALPQVTAPTLLVVGGDDWNVLELNDQAATLLRCPHDLAIVPRAGHLFEEPGALERVAQLAIGWFDRYLVMDTKLGAVA